MKIGIFKNLSIYPGERERKTEGKKDTQRVHVKISEVNMVCDCCVWIDGENREGINACLKKINICFWSGHVLERVWGGGGGRRVLKQYKC